MQSIFNLDIEISLTIDDKSPESWDHQEVWRLLQSPATSGLSWFQKYAWSDFPEIQEIYSKINTTNYETELSQSHSQTSSHIMWLKSFNLWIKSKSVTIQMKATEQYFPYVLTFESVMLAVFSTFQNNFFILSEKWTLSVKDCPSLNV